MKKWYDDWEISRNFKNEIEASLPNIVNGSKHITITGELVKNEEINWLVDILDCALYEISERDKQQKDNQLKALELDPNKKYLVIVGKKTGITAYDFASLDKNEIPKNTLFLLVQDINEIKLEELDDLQRYIDGKREEIKS